MSINRVSIAGYLTRDAELRTVNGNLAVLGFTVAINEKRKDRGSGQYVDAPVFVRCAVFGQRAEHLARYMTKGTKVMIDGRLHYSSYMKDDEQRSSLSVVVDQLEFGNVKPREENAMSQEQTAAPASPATTDSDFYDEDVWEQTGLCRASSYISRSPSSGMRCWSSSLGRRAVSWPRSSWRCSSPSS